MVISQASPEVDDLIVSEFEANDTAVSDVKVHVHTGGPVGNSQVTFRSMDIKASVYEPPTAQP